MGKTTLFGQGIHILHEVSLNILDSLGQDN